MINFLKIMFVIFRAVFIYTLLNVGGRTTNFTSYDLCKKHLEAERARGFIK